MDYKLKILDQADACHQAGELGALLCREGLYSSSLALWRHQRQLGILTGLTPKARGRKPNQQSQLVAENEQLKRQNQTLSKRLPAGRDHHRVPKKTCGDAEDAAEGRQHRMNTTLTLSQQVGKAAGQLTVHADRGSSMTSRPMALLLADLGVTKTHSRPHTSNDNPFSESHFKTLKYRPEFPDRFARMPVLSANGSFAGTTPSIIIQPSGV